MTEVEALLQPEVQAFIRSERSEAQRKALAFQPNPFPHIAWQSLLSQIASREKCRSKLPLWYSTPNIVYPPTLSVEQSSSEPLARYKASLVGGMRLLDASGGMGVDCWHMAQHFETTWHVEQQAALSAMAQHNFDQLGGVAIQCRAGDSIEYLQQHTDHWDWIYLDPARRHESKGKIFRLEDSAPPILQHLPLLLARASRILLKTSPLLDIQQGLTALQQVHEIHVVAYKGEVKELLWIIGTAAPPHPLIRTVELHSSQAFQLEYTGQQVPAAPLAAPLQFVYEPHPALMKAGVFDALAQQFELFKLHPNSHLFTSAVARPFPGKVYQTEAVWPYRKKELQAHIKKNRAHVVTRNFPETVEALRKQWQLGEAEQPTLFFTTLSPREWVVIKAVKIPLNASEAVGIT